MADQPSARSLGVVLTLVGIIFVVGIYPLTIVWPAGWSWLPAQPQYLSMIVGIYATLGVFLLWAARNPLQHLSLIWFTIWSSIVHAGIMGYHVVQDPSQRGHLFGDIAALLVVAVALAAVTPRRAAA